MRTIKRDLTEIVEELIASKREDEWYDFKEKYKDDKVDLVHDIICMANNRHRGDSYIIYGIEDKTFLIKGVENDEHRRNQQGITDILNKVPFAGGVRPRIEMETVKINNHEVDVLIIKDSKDVPYYLNEQYPKKEKEKSNVKDVCAGRIYTRVCDTNTPVDKNADINDIEFLWRKRFGLDLSVKERFEILLKDIDKWRVGWENPKFEFENKGVDWGNRNYCFHADFPEFQIVRADNPNDDWEPQCVFYTSSKMYSFKLRLMYHSTIIHETRLLAFDEFRKYLPKAKAHCTSNDFVYYYYNLENIEGLLLNLFTKGSLDISSREPSYNQFLVFKNVTEKESFDEYLNEHFNDHSDEEIKVKYKYQIQNDKEENGGGGFYSAFKVAKAAWLYEDWKQSRH